MLTFRNTNIVFVLIMALLVALDYFGNIWAWLYFAMLIFYSLILFYGSYYIGSNFYLKTICRGNNSAKKIAITFDDGPAIERTPAILQILKDYEVPAAFFCIGNRIAGNESLIKNIHEQGHIIGNHSYSHHFWFDLFLTKKMLADIQQMDAELKKVLPLQPKFFRPPYGVTTPPMAKALSKGGYTALGWSIRSMDTIATDNNNLFEKVITALQPGAIILFHDTCKITVETLPRIIEEARRKGYEFERLDKLVAIKPYAV
jgi:peptidoglycan/xylan/chitin deacetylase (PgdA/CDA1 family)